MVVWGGCRFVNDACSATALGNGGGRYDPAANSWQATSTTGAPEARRDHTAVWSGNEMIVWGGAGAAVYGNGARYDPAANTWTPTAAASLIATLRPLRRVGREPDDHLGRDERFHVLQRRCPLRPRPGPWSATATARGARRPGQPHGRLDGSEMIVWGGCSGRRIPVLHAHEHRWPLQPDHEHLDGNQHGRRAERPQQPCGRLVRLPHDRVGQRPDRWEVRPGHEHMDPDQRERSRRPPASGTPPRGPAPRWSSGAGTTGSPGPSTRGAGTTWPPTAGSQRRRPGRHRPGSCTRPSGPAPG